MLEKCSCKKGFPVISEVESKASNTFSAIHCCSHCSTYLFDVDLIHGMQLIATDNIANSSNDYVVPKGRLLRISAFGEITSSSIGLIFAGLFAAGAFHPEGFAAHWDINKILVEGN
jgi:hypothetical protein